MCSVYWLLILRDQSVMCSLGLICPVAASGHNYLALIRQGGLNPLILGLDFSTEFQLFLAVSGHFQRPPFALQIRALKSTI
jgi:hypothetical protein